MAHAPDAFRTARLTAERLRPEHFADYHRLMTDPRVMATLGGRVWAEAETRDALRKALDHWDRHGFGIYVFRDPSGALAGRAGLRSTEIDGRTETELLYAYLPEFWGSGLGTEAARALIGIGFGVLGVPDIVSFTLPTNVASQRVMQKAGLRYERDFVWHDLPHVFYRLRAGEPGSEVPPPKNLAPPGAP